MKNSAVSIILGILAIIAGFIALAHPLLSSLGIGIFTGWAFLFLGIATVISAFVGDQSNSRIWTIVVGILMFFMGWVLIKNPIEAVITLAYAASILLFASGLVKIFYGFKVNATSLKVLTIISGILSLIVAVLVFKNPFPSLGILLGVELIADGIALMALGFARDKGGVESV